MSGYYGEKLHVDSSMSEYSNNEVAYSTLREGNKRGLRGEGWVGGVES